MITPKNHEQIARGHGFVRKRKEEFALAGLEWSETDEAMAWEDFWKREPAVLSDPHRDFAPSDGGKPDAR